MKLNMFRLAGVGLGAALVITVAVRAADESKPTTKGDGFESLFNGKDLDGWKVGKNPETFKVENGEIVVNGVGPSHLFYDGKVHDHDWKNFDFKCDIKTKKNANSGVYFHTKYQEESWPKQGFEAQVNQTHGDPKKSGSIYDVKNVMNNSPAKDDEWYTYEIVVEGKKITLKVNGKTVNEWEQPDGWKGTDGWPGRVLSHGTFALQGHDPGSEVHYKNIMVKALPD